LRHSVVQPRGSRLVQAGVGLRIGGLLALRLQDVNFLGRSVRIEWQLDEVTRRRIETKTPRSRRTILLPQTVADALSLHIAEFPPLEDGTLFYVVNGQPYAHAMYGTRIFKAAVRKPAPLRAESTTYDLRHADASRLLAAGESVVAVAACRGGAAPARPGSAYRPRQDGRFGPLPRPRHGPNDHDRLVPLLSGSIRLVVSPRTCSPAPAR
jgi:integrase